MSEPVVLHHGREEGQLRLRRGVADGFNGLLGGSARVSMLSRPRGGKLPVGRAPVARQDAPAESTARGASPAGSRLSAAETAGERNAGWWRGARARRRGCGRRCSKGRWVKTSSTRWMPAGSTSPVGTATSCQAAEVQSSPPRRPRESATDTEAAEFKPERHPGCQLEITSTLATTAQTTLQPARAITLQPTRDRCGMSRDHLTRRAGRRSTTPPATISIRDDATHHERQLAKTLSLSVRPTYQASAAKPSAARFRQLQAGVSHAPSTT